MNDYDSGRIADLLEERMGLEKTESVPLAVKKAKEYLSGAIQHADELSVGSGHGPTHHFWQLWQQM